MGVSVVGAMLTNGLIRMVVRWLPPRRRPASPGRKLEIQRGTGPVFVFRCSRWPRAPAETHCNVHLQRGAGPADESALPPVPGAHKGHGGQAGTTDSVVAVAPRRRVRATLAAQLALQWAAACLQDSQAHMPAQV